MTEKKFDPMPHMIKLVVINCGKLLFPEEKNITKLYEDTTKLLGVPVIPTDSLSADHSPAPHEMTHGKMRECPQCGKKTFNIFGLCRSCKDSEGGRYKVMFKCEKCGHKEKSEEPMVVWLERMGIDFGVQSKKSLGIKIITDEGLK